MTEIRIAQAAEFLGVSDDTIRRWIQAGTLAATKDAAGRSVVDGAELARLSRERSTGPVSDRESTSSARNHFLGIVTAVKKDAVMAQVDIQAGPHRVVSLMSREAVDELGLEPGSIATASVKATQVVVETP